MKIKANIASSTKSFYGEISFTDVITNIIELGPPIESESWLIPGFIDLHVHGGGGHDVMEGELAIREMLKAHCKNGTTCLLATTVSAPFDVLQKVFQNIRSVMDNPAKGEAQLLGVHLEGPFLSEEKIGAQPHFTRNFSLKEVLELGAIAPIKIITVAPESGITHEQIKELKAKGTQVQLGHSNTSYENAKEFLDKGVKSVTHLFNAMSSFHHRAPGLAGAALAHANFAEIIPDLLHVHPGAIKMAMRAIPNTYFVTDATSGAGMPDGEYKLGSQTVYKCSGGVRLKDGTLAGSCLTMQGALLNALSLGLSVSDCVRKLSFIQSQLLGIKDRGDTKLGLRADFIYLDSSFKVLDTLIGGEKI